MVGQDLRSGARASPPANATSTPALLLIIVLAAIASVMCYRAFQKRFDTELRGAVQRHLAELFPKAKIQVERVSKGRGGSIVAEVVRMGTVVDGKPVQVFGAEEVIIQGQLDISDFIKQTIEVKQVELIGVQVDAWPLADGTWSIECLKPVEKPNKNAPKIVLNDSVIRIRQSAAKQAREIVIHGVQATVESYSRENASTVQLNPGQIGHHQPVKKLLRIVGSAKSSGLLEKVNAECHIDLNSKSILARGNFSGFQFSPKLLEQLPIELSKKLSQFSGLECEATSNFFSVSLSPNQPPEFECRGKLYSGKLQDSRLPYPIEKICSEFNCRNALLQLRNMTARSGEAKLSFSTDIMGLGLDSPMVIEAGIEDLDLDKRLYQSLPAAVQQQWDKLQLAGRVSGRLKLLFDGKRWVPEASITCQQVSLKPWLFPYEFTQVEGNIEYQDGKIKSKLLRGRASGQVVEAALTLSHVNGSSAAQTATAIHTASFQPNNFGDLNAQLVRAQAQAGQTTSLVSGNSSTGTTTGTQWLGSLQCRSLGGVPIDEDLMNALTPAGKPKSAAENFVRSLNMSGNVVLMNAIFQRDSIDNPKWHRTLQVNIYDGRMQYEKFRFPVYNIRGSIINEGDDWRLDGLKVATTPPESSAREPGGKCLKDCCPFNCSSLLALCPWSKICSKPCRIKLNKFGKSFSLQDRLIK